MLRLGQWVGVMVFCRTIIETTLLRFEGHQSPFNRGDQQSLAKWLVRLSDDLIPELNESVQRVSKNIYFVNDLVHGNQDLSEVTSGEALPFVEDTFAVVQGLILRCR